MLPSLLVASTFASSLVAAAGLDSALSRSMWGLAYEPDGVILPNCGATQAEVTADILKVAQLTPRIRLYGADCNLTALVLQGIKETNADLQVYPAIYLDGTDTVFKRQLDLITSAIKTYGTDHIAGITVGNEFLLNSYGSGSATDAKGVAARTTLLANVQTVNTTIKAMGLSKNIPLGTSDAGSAITLPLCQGVDYVMANVHPWFGSVDAAGSAVWTYDFFQEFDVNVCAKATNKPAMYIAETGWPTGSDNASATTNGANAEASVANLQTFLDTFICQANTNGTNYFMFEFSDEAWKAPLYGGVEPHWGLFNTDRTLKTGLKMPTCTVKSPTGGTVQQLNFGASSSSSSTSSNTSSTTSSPSTSGTSGSSTNTKSGASLRASSGVVGVLGGLVGLVSLALTW